MYAHADTHITRMIGGKEFVFVGFIRNDDPDGYVIGVTMLERVRAAGFEPLDDSDHLNVHKGEWADDPELAPYHIVTDERHPEYSRDFLCFDRGDRGRRWNSLDYRFGRDDLVACHAQ